MNCDSYIFFGYYCSACVWRHVAPLAMERLQYIRGVDTPTVLVVVYGNRAYEKALMELDAFAIPHGFKVIAGATFIGEHSYSTDKYPIAVGRPDESDLAFAAEFGKKIMEKIQTADSMDTLYPVDVRTINVRVNHSFLCSVF